MCGERPCFGWLLYAVLARLRRFDPILCYFRCLFTADEKLRQREKRAQPDASTRDERAETMAAATRLPLTRRRRRRREVYRWN